MNTLSEKDFDLTIHNKLFDVFYSISKNIEYNEIKEWCVAGWQVENSSDQRNINTILYSHPISTFITEVKKTTLNDLNREFIVGTTKEEVIKKKKEVVDNYFKDILNKLK